MSRDQLDALESLVTEVCTDSIRPAVRANVSRREEPGGKEFLRDSCHCRFRILLSFLDSINSWASAAAH